MTSSPQFRRRWWASLALGSLILHGCAYAPDWGEHTFSVRPEEQRLLPENAVIHVILGMWMDDWGVEISEAFVVTEQGAEPLASFPRQLFVKS